MIIWLVMKQLPIWNGYDWPISISDPLDGAIRCTWTLRHDTRYENFVLHLNRCAVPCLRRATRLRGPFQSLSLFKRLAVKSHVVLTLLVWYVKNTSVLSLCCLAAEWALRLVSLWWKFHLAAHSCGACPVGCLCGAKWNWLCDFVMADLCENGATERWEQPRFLAAPISVTGGISW